MGQVSSPGCEMSRRPWERDGGNGVGADLLEAPFRELVTDGSLTAECAVDSCLVAATTIAA
jgi:hypothetical protein